MKIRKGKINWAVLKRDEKEWLAKPGIIIITNVLSRHCLNPIENYKRISNPLELVSMIFGSPREVTPNIMATYGIPQTSDPRSQLDIIDILFDVNGEYDRLEQVIFSYGYIKEESVYQVLVRLSKEFIKIRKRGLIRKVLRCWSLCITY